MSTRGANPVRSANSEERHIRARWQGAGAADLTKVYGRGVVTVARTGTGAYTITFDEVFANFIGCNISVESASGRQVTGGTFTQSAKTFTFTVRDLATPTAQDLAVGEFVYIEAVYCDTGITQ